MKTVLVFDVWLPGFTYIKELHDEPGINVIFVHTSSLQTGQPAKEYQEFKRKFELPTWVHDFSEFDYCFDTLFKAVEPDSILVLSLHHIEARTALFFAKHNSIPTYFIPHGIFLLSDKPFESHQNSSLSNKLAKPFRMLPRVGYYLRFFCKFHAQMVRQGLRKLQPLITLKAAFDLIARYYYWQWHPNETVRRYYGPIIDNLILYDPSISDYYRKSYGEMLSGANIVRSGTLDTTRLIRQHRRKRSTRTTEGVEDCAYFISSPYPDYFTPTNTEIYAEIVGNLNGIFIEAGLSGLVYRPHPGEPADFTARICEMANVIPDYSPDLTGLISAKLVCGTSSSMLYCAIIMGKPIVIWDTARLTVCPPYYEPLLSYPTILVDTDSDSNHEVLREVRAAINSSTAAPEFDISKLGDPIADLAELVRRQPKSQTSSSVSC